MLWLVPALVAALAGCWVAWTRGLHTLAAVLGVCVFVAGRDADWQQAARELQGVFHGGAQASGLTGNFGARTPWAEWARGGELQCPRAIDASQGTPPAWLLDIRYAVREVRGEESPQTWHELPVAVVRMPQASGTDALVDVEAGAGLAAARNGSFLFVWKKPPAPAHKPGPAELAALVQQARALVTQLSPAPAARSNAAPAGPAPAGPRTPPR